MNRIESLPPDIELARLLQRCAARDSAAFRVLYDKTAPIVFARLLRMLRRPVAEEVLEEAYVRIWQRAAQFEAHRGKPLAWMVTLARYCAIDLVRGERDTLATDDPPAALPDEGTGASVAFGKPEHFDDCVERLGERTRECITLAFVAGRSRDEIARLTTNPPGDVKSRIRRGLLGLRECLSGSPAR